jgi:AraC-like DNA-binding protein
MDINDPDSPAFRALEYLCEVEHGDPFAWFTVASLSSDLGLSEQEGHTIFSFLVGKSLARYMGQRRAQLFLPMLDSYTWGILRSAEERDNPDEGWANELSSR